MSSINQTHPETVNDMIALLTKVKERFGGNVEVKFYRDGYGDMNDDSDSCEFDIRIMSNVSLLHDDIDEAAPSSRLIFAIDG